MMKEPVAGTIAQPGSAILLLTGPAGAGKSTVLASLLADRPHMEHWHVIVNDFGQSDPLAHVNAAFVTVSRVSACACCIGAVTMRACLVRVLRRRPARVVIEASALAHPASIRRVLAEPGIAPAVKSVVTVCVVNGRAVTLAPEVLALAREQMAMADHIVVNRSPAADAVTPVVAGLLETGGSQSVRWAVDGRIRLGQLTVTAAPIRHAT